MSNSKYILALDQGTTSSRAIIFNHQGQIINIAQKEFQQIYPKPGLVEHDPMEIWSSQVSVTTEVLAKANIKPSEIVALGITNQRETTIVWDRKTGKPIHNAIVWQDRRTASICDNLAEKGFAETIKNKTGLVLDAYFSGTKIQWVLDNVPEARQKAENGELAFGTVDSWLIWQLTHGKTHVTDVTNASRTLLFNIHDLTWDKELLDIFNIPESLLPEVKSSSEIYAETAEDILGENIPVAGIAGDQQSALFGQMCIEEGMVKNTYGTGCFMVLNTGNKVVASQNNLLSTVAWQIDGETTYALEGSVFVGGAIIQWLRDGLGILKNAPESEEVAQSVEDNGGVYFVPALTGLGAPHWDQYARGAILGITRGTSSAHIVRAAIEGIAFQVKDVLDAMIADTGVTPKELRVDGGAVANNLLMQFQSDIFGFEVTRPEVLETTALGAAYLAGLAVGYWESIDELKKQWQINQVFKANLEKEKVNELLKTWKKAVERTKNWVE